MTREFAVSHSYRVENLPTTMEEIGYSDLFKNDIVRHKTLPFVGLQPHPEASDHFMDSDFKGLIFKEKYRQNKNRRD